MNFSKTHSYFYNFVISTFRSTSNQQINTVEYRHLNGDIGDIVDIVNGPLELQIEENNGNNNDFNVNDNNGVIIITPKSKSNENTGSKSIFNGRFNKFNKEIAKTILKSLGVVFLLVALLTIGIVLFIHFLSKSKLNANRIKCIGNDPFIDYFTRLRSFLLNNGSVQLTKDQSSIQKDSLIKYGKTLYITHKNNSDIIMDRKILDTLFSWSIDKVCYQFYKQPLDTSPIFSNNQLKYNDDDILFVIAMTSSRLFLNYSYENYYANDIIKFHLRFYTSDQFSYETLQKFKNGLWFSNFSTCKHGFNGLFEQLRSSCFISSSFHNNNNNNNNNNGNIVDQFENQNKSQTTTIRMAVNPSTSTISTTFSNNLFNSTLTTTSFIQQDQLLFNSTQHTSQINQSTTSPTNQPTTSQVNQPTEPFLTFNETSTTTSQHTSTSTSQHTSTSTSQHTSTTTSQTTLIFDTPRENLEIDDSLISTSTAHDDNSITTIHPIYLENELTNFKFDF